MTDQFTTVQNSRVDSNTFDLTHDVKLSTQFGKLTPCCVMEVIPGDKFNIKASALVRLAPTIAPVMHRADVFMHYFFVPNRIIYPNWEKFITGGQYGLDATVHPTLLLLSTVLPSGGLLDYMGIPTVDDIGAGKSWTINPMALMAFQKIWHDYYRDRNITDDIEMQLVDGDNNAQANLIAAPRQRAWQHDYFTSALPWTQRGPEAMLPLGETAPIVNKEGFPILQRMGNVGDGAPIDTGDVAQNVSYHSITAGTDDGLIVNGGSGYQYLMVQDSHEVDLSAATASSIIEIRRAFKLQEWLEKNARGGSRYNESIKVHFGVDSSDARLQRPEYIGGFKSPIAMSEVLQTGQSDTTPQGNMAGHGISIGGSKNYSYHAEEHGYIIGIMSALPQTGYQQGIERHWSRSDKFDYPWPEFAHIGEQAVENKELYISGTSVDEDTFGYQARYSEMKSMNNRVCGDFRSTLDIWHMSRKFDALPSLNENFIYMDADEVERIFAVQGSTDNLWCQILNEVKVNRKLPIFGTPQIR